MPHYLLPLSHQKVLGHFHVMYNYQHSKQTDRQILGLKHRLAEMEI